MSRGQESVVLKRQIDWPRRPIVEESEFAVTLLEILRGLLPVRPKPTRCRAIHEPDSHHSGCFTRGRWHIAAIGTKVLAEGIDNSESAAGEPSGEFNF